MANVDLLTAVLDRSMDPFSGMLETKIGIDSARAERFATVLIRELNSLPNELRIPLAQDLNQPVPIRDRLLELSAFQELMSNAPSISTIPALVRTQIITQNYVCFVYLRDSLFRVLHRSVPDGTVLSLTTSYLTSKPINALRNAVAHGNWRYDQQHTAIEYWNETRFQSGQYKRHSVDQATLDFWQALARCTAYCALVALKPYSVATDLRDEIALRNRPEEGFQLSPEEKEKLASHLHHDTVESFLSWLDPEFRSEAMEMFDASNTADLGELHLQVAHPSLEAIVAEINQQIKQHHKEVLRRRLGLDSRT